MYEGAAKLSKTELEEFRAIQDMLEIRFPGVILNECLIQHQPRTRPPPLLKLDNKIQPGHQTSLPRNRNVGERQETEMTAINNDNHVLENNARQLSNPVDDPFPPRRRSEDPNDDPLNIPDFYFLPVDSRFCTALGAWIRAHNISEVLCYRCCGRTYRFRVRG